MTAAPSQRLRYLLRPVDERRNDRDLPLLSVSQVRGIVPRSELTSDEPRADDLSNYKVCRPGDIVVNRMSAYQGALGRTDHFGIVSPDYIVMRPVRGVDGRWLHHVMRSSWFVAEMAARIRGIGSIGTGNVRTPRVSAEEIGDIRVSLPAPHSQREIADFLDTETARIDALIAKKRLLLVSVREYLDVKREYTVWDNVARTIPLMHLTALGRPIMYGIVLPGPDVPDGIPIVKGGDVAANRLHPSRLCRTTAEIEAPYARARLRATDLVFAIRGGIGDVAVVPPDIEGANITQDVARIAPAPDVDPLWLMSVLRTRSVRAQVEQRTTGATVRGLNIWDLKRLQVPWSGIDRQHRDLEALNPAIRCHDAVVSRLTRQINLLYEHRQALITAAVTGEMEVPGVAA